MFIGHVAVALAAKKAAPRLSLGALLFAAQFLDLLWPALLLLGVERVRIDPGNTAFTPLDFVAYPVSHSLLAVLGWALLVAGAHFALRREPRPALLLGALVASHWLLDLLTHRPDLPLWPGGAKVGFELWASVPLTLAVELALFALGVAVYLRATRPLDRTGTAALWSLIVFLLAIYAANVLGPPPSSERAIAWAGLATWLLVAWATWADRHRAPALAA